MFSFAGSSKRKNERQSHRWEDSMTKGIFSLFLIAGSVLWLNVFTYENKKYFTFPGGKIYFWNKYVIAITLKSSNSTFISRKWHHIACVIPDIFSLFYSSLKLEQSLRSSLIIIVVRSRKSQQVLSIISLYFVQRPICDL